MIIGDVNTANKFYIINKLGSIEWVPNLETAQEYTQNPTITEWYGKDIYATSEELVYNKNGLCVLKSEYERDTEREEKENAIENLKQQIYEYNEEKLLTICKTNGYESFEQAFTWIYSTLEHKHDFAKKIIQYRDQIEEYTDDFLHDTNEKYEFKDNLQTFLENYPVFNLKK